MKLEDFNLAKDRRARLGDLSVHFPHYAAALIYKNTKIRLTGAVFSFAFGGHFSRLENSSHSDDTRGSIVIISCSVSSQKPSLSKPSRHSETTAGTHCAPYTQLCRNKPTAKTKQGRLLSHWVINESTSRRFQHLFLGKRCRKHWTYRGAN